MKLNSKKDTKEKAIKSLEEAFLGIPFVKLKKVKTDAKIGNSFVDLKMDALVSDKPVTFIGEVKSQGDPRFVRMAVAELKDYLTSIPSSYGILIAPYLSDDSRKICKEDGIGCVDLAGNAFLSFKNIFIERSGRPNPIASVRVVKSVFSQKSSRVLRVLFENPSKRWHVEDMAKESGISLGLASKVKQALLSEEWIKEEGKQFYFLKLQEALNQWSENYSYEKNASFSFYSGLTDDQLEDAVKKECKYRKVQYGLALFSGARKVAPYVRFQRFFAYLDSNIEAIADVLQLKKVDSGANVTLLQPYDEGVFYGLQTINGTNVVSDIQLYLDLKRYKGRGEEAAQTLFEQRIKPKW